MTACQVSANPKRIKRRNNDIREVNKNCYVNRGKGENTQIKDTAKKNKCGRYRKFLAMFVDARVFSLWGIR